LDVKCSMNAHVLKFCFPMQQVGLLGSDLDHEGSHLSNGLIC
jgi:hypothetical protein